MAQSQCLDKTEELCDAYFNMLASQNRVPPQNALSRDAPRFVNTSMHGVSHPFVTRAFELCGLKPVIPVPEQQEPDPEFPTVKFPNPEEKGMVLVVRERDFVDVSLLTGALVSVK